ncbi:MAG: dodecin [Planctomycetota bacterium]|jgi:flavin-binding protein dodecin
MGKTYKKIEIVGTSEESFAKAVETGVAKAAETLHSLDWFEVTELRGRIDGGRVAEYQVSIKLGMRVD